MTGRQTDRGTLATTWVNRSMSGSRTARRQAPRGVALHRQLMAITIAGILLTLVVVQSALVSVTRVDRATEVMKQIINAQRWHQDGDMMHDALRADVFDALLVGSAVDSKETVLTQMNAHALQFRRDLDTIQSLGLAPDLKQTMAKVREPLVKYIENTEHVARLAVTDRATAVAALPGVEEAFFELADAQVVVTDALAQAADREQRHVEASERSAKRRVVSASIAALFGLVVLAVMLHLLGKNSARILHDLHATNDREQFRRELGHALEMVDRESDAHRLVERTVHEVAPGAAVELLLGESGRGRLRRVATNPSAPAPGCDVTSAWECMAVRRASTLEFASSEDIGACPHLQGRESGACSAQCTPVSFMGRALGVLHTIGVAGSPPLAPTQADAFASLADQLGNRLGTMRALEQSQRQATTDPLTGLLNRRAFENRVAELMEAGMPFALAMADLDHFKGLNDRYGHEIGDRALCHFATVIGANLRADDTFARYGGEEFAIVLPGMTAADAGLLLNEQRILIEHSAEERGAYELTASFGVTDSDCGDTLDEMLRVADGALFRAKALGRNRVEVANGFDHLPEVDTEINLSQPSPH